MNTCILPNDSKSPSNFDNKDDFIEKKETKRNNWNEILKSGKLPQIIGVTGRKFNGKDTLAEYLKKKYGYQQMMFAKPIKDLCRLIFGFNEEQLYGSTKETLDERWGVTPRDMFQYIGTEMFRKMMANKIPGIGEGFWIKCLMEQVKSILRENPDARIVISDVRFPNEIDVIRQLGGLLIRVKRPSVNNSTDVHESEIYIEQLEVDFELLNDSTIDSLYNKFDGLLK
jgi:hypothetical protein